MFRLLLRVSQPIETLADFEKGREIRRTWIRQKHLILCSLLQVFLLIQ